MRSRSPQCAATSAARCIEEGREHQAWRWGGGGGAVLFYPCALAPRPRLCPLRPKRCVTAVSCREAALPQRGRRPRGPRADQTAYPPRRAACPSRRAACPSRRAACPSRRPACPSRRTACPSRRASCPSRRARARQSGEPACELRPPQSPPPGDSPRCLRRPSRAMCAWPAARARRCPVPSSGPPRPFCARGCCAGARPPAPSGKPTGRPCP